MGCTQSVAQEDQDATAADAGAAPLILGIQTRQSAPGLAVSLAETMLVSTTQREGSTSNGRVFEYANGALQRVPQLPRTMRFVQNAVAGFINATN